MPFRLLHPGRSLRPDPVALGRLLGPELAKRPDHGGLVQGEELRLAGVGAGVVPGEEAMNRSKSAALVSDSTAGS